MGPKTQRVLLL